MRIARSVLFSTLFLCLFASSTSTQLLNNNRVRIELFDVELPDEAGPGDFIPHLLTARVLSPSGYPIPNATVRFEASRTLGVADGTFRPVSGVVTTDAYGRASVRFYTNNKFFPRVRAMSIDNHQERSITFRRKPRVRSFSASAIDGIIVPTFRITTGTPLQPPGVLGLNYSLPRFQAVDGVEPYRPWKAVNNALPPGMSLGGSDGSFMGIPSVLGTHTFEITVDDATDAQARKKFTWEVKPPPPLSIITGSPLSPNGIEGNAFGPVPFSATGGKPPYRNWTMNVPPAGMQFTAAGSFSGAPSTRGTYSFTVGVADSAGNSATKNFTWQVTAPPLLVITTPSPLPAGSIGRNYSATFGASGGKPPYSWSGSQIPAGFALAGSGSFTGSTNTAGTYTFSVTVRDAGGSTATGNFSLAINEAPLLRIVTDRLDDGVLNRPYNQNVTADGGVTPYAWSATGLPPNIAISSTTGALSGTPTAAGLFNVSVNVTDSVQRSASKTLKLKVIGPPRITTTSPLPPGKVGLAYNVTLRAVDGQTPYNWSVTTGALPAGLALSSTSGDIIGAPMAVGDFSFTVKVTDRLQQFDLRPFLLRIEPDPPTITTLSPLPDGMIGMQYQGSGYQLQAFGGFAPYSWRVSTGALPQGMLLSEGGALLGIPAVSDAFSFEVTVTDRIRQTASKTFALTIRPFPPVIVSASPLPSAKFGRPYVFQFQAINGYTPYSWSVAPGSTLPTGLGLNATNGVLSGSATVSGTFAFRIEVRDRYQQSAGKDFLLTVSDPPVITSFSPLRSGQQGVPYTFTFAATGGSTPYSWSCDPTLLPPGFSLSIGGVLSGTTTTFGDYRFTVTVKDRDLVEGSKVFDLHIDQAPPPEITSISPLPSSKVGVQWSFLFAATGGTLPYRWSADWNELPTGLVLTTAGVLSGKPWWPGDYEFSIIVTDALNNSSDKQFTLTIADSPLVILTPSPLPNGREGKAYRVQLAAAGGVTPYSWTWWRGTTLPNLLPQGLLLSPDGILSGTPLEFGVFNFNLLVWDARSVTESKNYTLTIAESPPPVIDSASPLPDAIVGLEYQFAFTLKTDTGAPPLTWWADPLLLPDGLTLAPTGVLSGIPSPYSYGLYDFTVSVVDSLGKSDAKEFLLLVRGPKLTLEVTNAYKVPNSDPATYAAAIASHDDANTGDDWVLLTLKTDPPMPLTEDDVFWWGGEPVPIEGSEPLMYDPMKRRVSRDLLRSGGMNVTDVTAYTWDDFATAKVVVAQVWGLEPASPDLVRVDGENAVTSYQPGSIAVVRASVEPTVPDVSAVYGQLLEWNGGNRGARVDESTIGRGRPACEEIMVACGVSEASLTAWVVRVNLDISDTTEASIAVNSDDDNSSGESDLDEAPVISENDLVPLVLKIEPEGVPGIATLDLTGAPHLWAYAQYDKSGWLPFGFTWNLSAGAALPDAVWLEGRALSLLPADQTIS